MAHKNAATTEEILQRREKIRVFMAKGVVKPSRLLATPDIKALYSRYKSPYTVIINDQKWVRKQNAEIVRQGKADEVLGEYIEGCYTQLQTAYATLPGLNENAKVGMHKIIMELREQIARAKGVDTKHLDPKLFNLNIQNDVIVDDREGLQIELRNEDWKEVGNLIAERGTANFYMGKSKDSGKE